MGLWRSRRGGSFRLLQVAHDGIGQLPQRLAFARAVKHRAIRCCAWISDGEVAGVGAGCLIGLVAEIGAPDCVSALGDSSSAAAASSPSAVPASAASLAPASSTRATAPSRRPRATAPSRRPPAAVPPLSPAASACAPAGGAPDFWRVRDIVRGGKVGRHVAGAYMLFAHGAGGGGALASSTVPHDTRVAVVVGRVRVDAAVALGTGCADVHQSARPTSPPPLGVHGTYPRWGRGWGVPRWEVAGNIEVGASGGWGGARELVV